MKVFLKSAITFLFFFSPILLSADTAVIPAHQDNCVLCIREGKANCGGCLEELERRDLSFLSGNREPVSGWMVDENIVLKLCRQVEAGDNKALAIGLRLAVILDGRLDEDLIEALGRSMAENPEKFLGNLQSMLDFSKKGNQEGLVKKYFWDAFMESDFGCGDKVEKELMALTKRKETIQKIDDRSLEEARTYLLTMLNEKIDELSSGT
jgi:hypothetical protein